MIDDVRLLQLFAKKISISLSRTDALKWPIRTGLVIEGVLPTYAIEYADQLQRFMSSVMKEDWPLGFPNALSIWKVSHHVINGLEQSGFDKSAIAESVLSMAKMIRYLEGNTIQCGSHCIMPEYEVANLVKMIDLTPSDTTYPELMALLWGYSDSLLFQCRELCTEYHGPYRLDNGMQLVVLDVKCLDDIASVIWGRAFKPINIAHIRTCRLIPPDCKIFVDAYNNIDVTQGTLKGANAGFIAVDGIPLYKDEVSKFRLELVRRLTKQAAMVDELSVTKLSEAYVKLFWLRKKKMAGLLGEEWMPTEQVMTKAIEWGKSLDRNASQVCTIASANELSVRYDYSPYLKSHSKKSALV